MLEICHFGRKIVRPRNVVICSRGKTEPWEITCFAPFQRFCLIWGQELQHLGVWWLFINREMKKCWHLSDKHNMAFFCQCENLWIGAGMCKPNFCCCAAIFIDQGSNIWKRSCLRQTKTMLLTCAIQYSSLRVDCKSAPRIAKHRGGEVGTSSGFGGRCSDIWDTLPLNESALEQKSFAGWFALLPNIELHCDALLNCSGRRQHWLWFHFTRFGHSCQEHHQIVNFNFTLLIQYLYHAPGL